MFLWIESFSSQFFSIPDSRFPPLLQMGATVTMTPISLCRLLKTDAAKEACTHLIKIHGINPLLQTELDLSQRKIGDSGVMQICALLEDSHCKVQTLKSVV